MDNSPLKAVTIKDLSFPSRNKSPSTVDVIHPSKDAIHPSKDVVESGSNRDVSLAGAGIDALEGDVLKSLIPTQPNPKWPPWAMDYLQAIIDSRTDGEAARRIGLTYRTTYEARLAFADLASAWDICRKFRDSLIVSDLEDASLDRALKCDPTDRMSASLNMFHLKARDDKYKDKQQLGSVAINIVLGCDIPDPKRVPEPITEADYED